MAETTKFKVVTGDYSPVAGAGSELPGTMTPEGRLRVDAELSVGDVALTLENYMFDVTVTPTVTSGAYSAGDIVGALMTFALSRVADAPVTIDRVQVTVKAAVTSSLTLVLFSADPTATTKTDNAAYSLNAADAFKVIASIPITALGGYLTDHGTPNTYDLGNLDLTCKPATGTVNVYALLIDGIGWTLTSTSDVQVRLAGRGA